ncbi:receptor-type tyrosine-protein phosphatase mu-like, partial [Saccoglossus kowalevskii]|uniref:Receptor-type tyrosine-protein phosphatase kappa-like n=1 Tax=Saccoglossus kowalevskii TaxID=10224 RepID=A0ABM0M479_SACKO
VRLKDRTQRSLTIEWKKQPYHDILSYMITVSLVNRPYDDLYTSTSTVTPFEYSTGKTEVTASQLKSGSEYEIQVQPYFTDGPGSLSKPFRFMTKIKVPLPSDIRLPVLLDSNTLTTQLVLLEPIKSQDAPISSYKVVLRTVKEAKRRKRDDYSILDEDSWQLVDYDSAQQLGTEHYVTAGFDSNALPREFVIGNGELYNEYYNAPLVPGSTYEVFFGMISETELETEAVFTTDPVSFTVDGQSESIQPVILAAVVGVLLVILAGVVTVLCVVWCQRRAKKAQPPVVENGRPPIYLPSKERRQNVKKLVVDAHELQ